MGLKILLIPLMVFASSVWALDVSFSQPSPDGVVELRVRNAPQVYGADVLVGYDSRFFEVLDQDKDRQGTQIKGGDFFPAGAYLLDNRIDLTKGEIHYAIALVRPMEDVSGDGLLASFKLKAKQSGETVLELKQAQFGTQEGELYKVEPIKVVVQADASGRLVSDAKEPQDNATTASLSTETILMAIIALLLVVIIILLVRKK